MNATKTSGVLALLLLAWASLGADPPPKPAIAVLPLGLTADTHARYPQLAERSVGFGLHNLLVEELAKVGRFRFVEEKKEVVEDLLERQWLAASGAVAAESAVAYGKLTGARYVVYGEVVDFATRQLKRRRAETRISVQIRWVDVETSEYVPASGSGRDESRGKVLVRGDDTQFARSTVGLVSHQAIAQAVAELLRRLDSTQEGGPP